MERKLLIEFTRPKGKIFPAVSWIIRKVQGTEYSHVRFSWVRTKSCGSEQKLVYEASGTNIRFVGPKAQEEMPVEVVKSFEIDLDRDEKKRLIDFAIDYAYVSYGFWQLIGIGVAKMFCLKKNPFAKGDYSQVCSELVHRGLKYIKGWDLNMNPDLAGPKEIEMALITLIRNKTEGIRAVG